MYGFPLAARRPEIEQQIGALVLQVIKEKYAASDPCSVGMLFRPFFNDGNLCGASFVFCRVLAAVPLDARCEI